MRFEDLRSASDCPRESFLITSVTKSWRKDKPSLPLLGWSVYLLLPSDVSAPDSQMFWLGMNYIPCFLRTPSCRGLMGLLTAWASVCNQSLSLISVCLSIHPSIHPSIMYYLLLIFLSIHPSTIYYLSIHLFIIYISIILEKEMTTHSSILAWRIPWTEEPGGATVVGSQRVRHDWVTNHICHLSIHPSIIWWHGASHSVMSDSLRPHRL